MNMEELLKYPCVVRPLSEEDGGGYMASFPDLPLVAGDGPTPEDALADGLDALKCALEAMREWGKPIPEPGQATGKMALRLPKSLHLRLMARADAEGVSINTTAVSLIAEGLGREESRQEGVSPKTTTRIKQGTRNTHPKAARKAS